MTYKLNIRIHKIECAYKTPDLYFIITIPGTDLKYETKKQEYYEPTMEFNEGFQIPITDLQNQILRFEVASFQDEKYTPIAVTSSIPIKNIPIDSPPAPIQGPILTLDQKKLGVLYSEVTLWSAGLTKPIKVDLLQCKSAFAVFMEVSIYEDTSKKCTLLEVGESFDFDEVDLRSIIEVKVIDLTYQSVILNTIKFRSSSINNEQKHAVLEKTVENNGEFVCSFSMRFQIGNEQIPNNRYQQRDHVNSQQNSGNTEEVPPDVLQLLLNPMVNPMVSMIPPNEREAFMRFSWSKQTPQFKAMFIQMAQMSNQQQQYQQQYMQMY